MGSGNTFLPLPLYDRGGHDAPTVLLAQSPALSFVAFLYPTHTI